MFTTPLAFLSLLLSATSILASPTPAPVSHSLSFDLNTRQTVNLLVQCKADIFQNPDEDIANVVCEADAKCEGGDDEALEVLDSRGVDAFEVTCFGCAATASKMAITSGCVFI